MTDQYYRPDERRQTFRLAINHHSSLRITLDGAAEGSESILGVTITDISCGGLMAAGAGQLIPGARITLDVPLVGWRDAEVMWIADNRAGCRFLKPLNLEELSLAAAHSERLAAECPAFAAQIADLFAPPAHPMVEPEKADRSAWPLWWLAPAAILALGSLVFALALILFDIFD